MAYLTSSKRLIIKEKQHPNYHFRPQRFTNKKAIFLLVILLIAIFFRLRHINQPYIDTVSWRQASTAMMAENFYKVNSNILYPEVNWSGPGPSYNGREFQTATYLASLLYHLVGQHDWVGRLISLLFGVWGVFALYKLVNRLWDQEHGLAAAAIMAFMPLAVFVERSFIPDPVMVSLVTTSLWMLTAFLQTDKRKYLYLAAAVGCLGFLTKLPGMLVGLALVYEVVKILKARNQFHVGKIKMLLTVGIIAVIPVLCYYLWARYLSLNYPPYHFAGENNWLWNDGFKVWAKNDFFIHWTMWLLREQMLGLPILCLFVIGLLLPPPAISMSSSENIKTLNIKAPWFFHWWLVGFAVFYCIGAEELVHNFWNFHIASPAIAALAGRSLLIILRKPNSVSFSKFRMGAIVCILFIAAFYALQKMYSADYAREGYKMGKALNKFKKPEDLVVVVSEDLGSPVPIYYSGCRGWTFPPTYLNGKFYNIYELPANDKESERLLEDFIKEGADWFGIVQMQADSLQKYQPAFMDYLDRNYYLQEKTSDYIIFKLSSKTD